MEENLTDVQKVSSSGEEGFLIIENKSVDDISDEEPSEGLALDDIDCIRAPPIPQFELSLGSKNEEEEASILVALSERTMAEEEMKEKEDVVVDVQEIEGSVGQCLEDLSSQENVTLEKERKESEVSVEPCVNQELPFSRPIEQNFNEEPTSSFLVEPSPKEEPSFNIDLSNDLTNVDLSTPVTETTAFLPKIDTSPRPDISSPDISSESGSATTSSSLVSSSSSSATESSEESRSTPSSSVQDLRLKPAKITISFDLRDSSSSETTDPPVDYDVEGIPRKPKRRLQRGSTAGPSSSDATFDSCRSADLSTEESLSSFEEGSAASEFQRSDHDGQHVPLDLSSVEYSSSSSKSFTDVESGGIKDRRRRRRQRGVAGFVSLLGLGRFWFSSEPKQTSRYDEGEEKEKKKKGTVAEIYPWIIEEEKRVVGQLAADKKAATGVLPVSDDIDVIRQC